jgi:hypothetical protein
MYTEKRQVTPFTLRPDTVTHYAELQCVLSVLSVLSVRYAADGTVLPGHVILKRIFAEKGPQVLRTGMLEVHFGTVLQGQDQFARFIEAFNKTVVSPQASHPPHPPHPPPRRGDKNPGGPQAAQGFEDHKYIFTLEKFTLRNDKFHLAET